MLSILGGRALPRGQAYLYGGASGALLAALVSPNEQNASLSGNAHFFSSRGPSLFWWTSLDRRGRSGPV